MNKYSFQNNELIADGHVLYFEHDISEIVTVRDILVVLLEIRPLEDNIKNNVYGVKDGSVIWQVQDVREILPANSFTFNYSFIRIENNNDVIIADDMGLYFSVDVKTGNLTFLDWRR